MNQILPEFLKAEAMSSIAIKAAEIDSLKRSRGGIQGRVEQSSIRKVGGKTTFRPASCSCSKDTSGPSRR